MHISRGRSSNQKGVELDMCVYPHTHTCLCVRPCTQVALTDTVLKSKHGLVVGSMD